MDTYKKTILIDFGIDEPSLKKASEKVESIGKVLAKHIAKSLSDDLFKVTTSFSKNMSSESFMSDQFSKTIRSLSKVFSGFSKGFKEGLVSIADNFLSKLGSLFTGGLDELDSMLQYSKLTDQSIRETKFKYGFSSAEAYGFDKAKELLGIASDNSLYYMNEQESKQFREKMVEYANKYTKLADNGTFEKIQEYNVEMKDFQEQLKLQIVEWIVDNKDLIKNGMTAIMKLTEFTMSALSELTNFLVGDGPSQDELVSRTTEVISNYSNQQRNVNVVNNNTYNGGNDDGRSLFEKASILNVKQISKAIAEM